MSVRQSLNRYPALTVVAAIVLLGAAALITYQSRPAPPPRPPTAFYYTVDDGKTLFAGPMALVPPFDHEGKEAVLAHVYSCDKGKSTFVGYLEKYKDEYKQKMEAPATQASVEPAAGGPAQGGRPTIPAFAGPEAVFNRLVKKPGESEWHPFTSAEGQAACSVSCDGDYTKVEKVYPQKD